VLPRDNERLESLETPSSSCLRANISWRLFRSGAKGSFPRAARDRKCSFPGDGCTTAVLGGALEVGTREEKTGGRDKQTLLPMRSKQ